MTPHVTVVTICRNAAAEIEPTILSVLSQTRAADIEYIIVDGGSTDGTVDIIRRHEASLARWSSEPDRGISDAFNKGARNATGRWVNFMNAGDRFADARAVDRVLVAAPDADVIYGRCALEAADGRVLGTIGGPFSRRAFRTKMTLPHQSLFMKRAFFERYGWFDPALKRAMDYELLLRAGRGLRVAYVDALIAVQRAGGVSQADAPATYVEYRTAQIRHGVPAFEADAYYAYFMLKHAAKVGLRRAGLGGVVRRLRDADT